MHMFHILKGEACLGAAFCTQQPTRKMESSFIRGEFLKGNSQESQAVSPRPCEDGDEPRPQSSPRIEAWYLTHCTWSPLQLLSNRDFMVTLLLSLTWAGYCAPGQKTPKNLAQEQGFLLFFKILLIHIFISTCGAQNDYIRTGSWCRSVTHFNSFFLQSHSFSSLGPLCFCKRSVSRGFLFLC